MSTSNGVDGQKEKSDSVKRIYTYIAAGVVVLAVIAWGIYAYNHNGTQIGTEQAPQQANSNNAAAVATSTPTSTPASVAGKLSYGAAIQKYTERFQFSNGCQGTPATIAVRKGTPVMLDNRNAAAITIKADTQTFKIASYNYDVFYPEVLGNLVVNCNGKASVTLNVEK
jgi:uncharacterized membrane protein